MVAVHMKQSPYERITLNGVEYEIYFDSSKPTVGADYEQAFIYAEARHKFSGKRLHVKNTGEVRLWLVEV